MGLVLQQEKRLEHPKEPGTWFTILVPLTAGDMAHMGNPEGLGAVKLAAVTIALKAWSFDAPCTPENIARLDVNTFNWLADAVIEGSELPDPEKKDSTDSSTLTSEPVTAASPVSSAT